MGRAVAEHNHTSSTRLYAVGDIHGCYDAVIALEKKLTKLSRRGGFDGFKIISVGDLIDRGPDTKKVMDHFVRGKVAGTHDLILGNHETFLMAAFTSLRPDLLKDAGIQASWYHEIVFQMFRAPVNIHKSWKINGGKEVLLSYDADIDDISTWNKIPSSHLQLIFDAPLIVTTPKTVISHALMAMGDFEIVDARDRGLPVANDLTEAAVIRCLWERMQPAGFILPGRRHVSGHTPLSGVERNQLVGTIQIDTAAVYGGQLTALDLRTLRTTSVQSSVKWRRTQD